MNERPCSRRHTIAARVSAIRGGVLPLAGNGAHLPEALHDVQTRLGEGQRDMKHEERNRGEQRSDQKAAGGHQSSLHEATPRSFFPQIDDQQAENEGWKMGSNEAEPALGRRLKSGG